MRSDKAMTETLRLRVSEREKNWLEVAAGVQGLTLSEFIRAAALSRAEHILCQPKPLRLASWDSGESNLPLLSGPTADEMDEGAKVGLAVWARRVRKRLEENMAAQQSSGN